MSSQTRISVPEYFGFKLTEHAHRVVSSGCDVSNVAVYRPVSAGETIIVEQPAGHLHKALEDATRAIGEASISPIS